MTHTLIRHNSFTLLLIMALAAALAPSDARAGNRHQDDKAGLCYRTTDAMKAACFADIVDDFNTAFANCLNTDNVRDCKREARTDYRDARAECRVQTAGRNDLCARLPDAGPYITEIDPANFKTPEETQFAGNRFFPLVIGTVSTYRNEEDNEDIVVTVTDRTRVIEGVTTIVVRDVVSVDGELIEDTDDYFAEDRDGNVWYFGEIAKNFEDGFLTDLEGSFIAGEDGAQAGIVMLANPMVGDVYRQEFALGDAEDAAEVLALDGDLSGDHFDCNNACLVTEDFIPTEPDATEFKYFIEGVGLVAEQLPDGDVVLELISIETP
ncbi:hypothetical protein [Woeseia oceani]|nr:hypothetical protein [Woeseia oceani]